MHSAIVYAVIPERGHEAQQKAGALYASILRLEENKTLQKLGDFVWQVNFQKSPEALARLIQACDQLDLPYRILPLADEPRWIVREPATRLSM